MFLLLVVTCLLLANDADDRHVRHAAEEEEVLTEEADEARQLQPTKPDPPRLRFLQVRHLPRLYHGNFWRDQWESNPLTPGHSRRCKTITLWPQIFRAAIAASPCRGR